mgnify:CR=1 FL=1
MQFYVSLYKEYDTYLNIYYYYSGKEASILYILSIVLENHPHKFTSILNKQIKPLVKEDIKINEYIIKHDNFYVIEYRGELKGKTNYLFDDYINMFKYCIANTIYEFIKIHEETYFLNKIIDYDYYYFNNKEKNEIKNNIKKILEKEEKNPLLKGRYKQDKYAVIENIIDYFEENNSINLRGFVIFRLKTYLMGLQQIIEYGVEEFLMNREFNEFIKLLKYFVDIQEPKIDTVHLLLKAENKHKLYDKYGKLIDDNYLQLIAAEIIDKDINYEDLLISSLITIAPRKLFIHKISKFADTELIKTLSKIFVDRIKICDGCNWCNIKAQAKKE